MQNRILSGNESEWHIFFQGRTQSHSAAKNYVVWTPDLFCLCLPSAGIADAWQCTWFIWCWGLHLGLGKHHLGGAEHWTQGQISTLPTETSLPSPRMTLKEQCRLLAPLREMFEQNVSAGSPLLGIPSNPAFLSLCILLLDGNIREAEL